MDSMVDPAYETPSYETIVVGDARLRAATWGTGAVSVVMLHDGLGSLTQWRSLPAVVAARTGRTVFAYERSGHGESLPVPSGPWPPDWLHREAEILGEVLATKQIELPVLIGHSDGGSIAMVHAIEAGPNIAGVVALAAHSWVEQICFDNIVEMRAKRSLFVNALARHHLHPAEVFEAWSGAWVSDAFRSWDIRSRLGAIEVPTLIAQGKADPHASDAQAIETAEAVGGNARWCLLDDLGHMMHHDDVDAVADLLVGFMDPLRDVAQSH